MKILKCSQSTTVFSSFECGPQSIWSCSHSAFIFRIWNKWNNNKKYDLIFMCVARLYIDKRIQENRANVDRNFWVDSSHLWRILYSDKCQMYTSTHRIKFKFFYFPAFNSCLSVVSVFFLVPCMISGHNCHWAAALSSTSCCPRDF